MLLIDIWKLYFICKLWYDTLITYFIKRKFEFTMVNLTIHNNTCTQKRNLKMQTRINFDAL